MSVKQALDLKRKSVNRVIQFEETEFFIQFLASPRATDTLIVRFHGALQRDKRPLPAFQANLNSMIPFGHQISICDPTMMSRGGFSLGWYSGHDRLDVQNMLRRLLREIKTVLGTKKIVFLGSSGGGFAALFYSYYDPESTAVVMAPQTRIGAHIPKAVKSYLDSCWPGLTLDEVSDRICIDLCSLYADGHENSVVYIESAGDFLHNHRHMAPFIHSVHNGGERCNSKFILASGFWGRHGHGGAIPHGAYLPWVKAAILAKGADGVDILDAYSSLPRATEESLGRGTGSQPGDPTRLKNSVNGADIRTADFLRDFHLRQPLES